MRQNFNSITELTIFFVTLFFSVFNTGIFLALDKMNVVDWYETYRKRWMPKHCEFCAFFWVSLIELITWYFVKFTFDWYSFLMVPMLAICAAVISRYFVKA